MGGGVLRLGLLGLLEHRDRLGRAVKLEIKLAQVQKAQQQYGYPLIMGRANPSSGLSTYLSKLHDAGVDKVMSEIQRQLDTWKSSK